MYIEGDEDVDILCESCFKCAFTVQTALHVILLFTTEIYTIFHLPLLPFPILNLSLQTAVK